MNVQQAFPILMVLWISGVMFMFHERFRHVGIFNLLATLIGSMLILHLDLTIYTLTTMIIVYLMIMKMIQIIYILQ